MPGRLVTGTCSSRQEAGLRFHQKKPDQIATSLWSAAARRRFFSFPLKPTYAEFTLSFARRDLYNASHYEHSTPTLIVVLLMCSVSACGQSEANKQADSPQPKTLTAADLTKLRWIEGSWRGTGDIDKPFYERYRFENDTTLLVESFDDEKFEKVTDASRFELKDGHFGKTEGESGSVATAFDDNSITFSPLGKARNSFRFQRESADTWKAILNWKDANGAPKERIYKMERITK